MKSRVVVSAIIEKNGKILLGQKPKNIGPYPNTWHLPGGGIKLDEESLEEAVRREVREETTLEMTNLRRVSFDEDYEPDKNGEMTHYLFLVYKASYKSGELKASDDLQKFQWVDKNEIKKLPLTRPSRKLFKELGWM